MKHVVVSSADVVTERDLAAFIANVLGDGYTEPAIALATELIRHGWVSVIRIDPAPAS